jgi:hypothetical protein
MRIFVSYRRGGGSYQTGRLCDRLAARYGRGSVFFDTLSIPLGSDFRDVIRREVEQSSVVLVAIGDGWLEAHDADGNLRLHQPEDFVRLEIATALSCGVPVIPLLFDQAQMPASEQLPENVRELAFRNGQRIQPDPSFHDDVDRLIEWLERTIKDPPPAPATANRAALPPAPLSPDHRRHADPALRCRRDGFRRL